MKLDILAIGSHPDDVELGCSGTLIKHAEKGYKTGIVDLTKGELGTRGTVGQRKKEAAKSVSIMGGLVRENMGFADGFFKNNKEHQIELIKVIRKYQPEVVICNAKSDRHPDHGRAAELVRDACFLSGLSKIETRLNKELQKAYRPRALYHYIQALHTDPDFVVDITSQFDKKMQAITAYKSQFYNPGSAEPQTFISTKEFLEFVKSRAMHFGIPAGVSYAEGFHVNRTIGVNNLMELL